MFNEGNRKVILWIVRHKRPSSARVMLNIYHHQSILVVRGKSKKKCSCLHSSEGSTQGVSLAIVGYGVLLLPLIIQLKSEFPKVKLPWYVDDCAPVSTFKIFLYFLSSHMR